jgi:hypothetical protein
MNTEKINTYKKIIETLKDVNGLRTFQNINTPERIDLDAAALHLEELSWKILSDDINQSLENIQFKTDELKALGKKMEEQYESLKNISANIQKTADIAGVLVEIIAKAISAGIL